jgi:hypothetical protein
MGWESTNSVSSQCHWQLQMFKDMSYLKDYQSSSIGRDKLKECSEESERRNHENHDA